MISSVVIVIALIIALIHRGVIPKFWETDSEPATEVMAPADGTEPPQPQTDPAEVQEEPDETQQENGDETVDEEPSDEPDVSETVEEADPAQQLEDYLESVFARADLGKYASAEDAVKLRKMLELTIKGLMNERILEDAFQPEMLYEEITEYLNLSRRLAERSTQPSDEAFSEK